MRSALGFLTVTGTGARAGGSGGGSGVAQAPSKTSRVAAQMRRICRVSGKPVCMLKMPAGYLLVAMGDVKQFCFAEIVTDQLQASR